MMRTLKINVQNEWYKIIHNPQITWLLLIGGWTIVGWSWLFNGERHSVYDISSQMFVLLLLTRLISLPIISMVFFVTLHTERQNETYSWLSQLPIDLLKWHLAKILTAWFICVLTLIVALLLAAGVMYWYATDMINTPTPISFLWQFWGDTYPLLIFPLVLWLTFYSLSLFIRTPTIAILTLLSLSLLGGFSSVVPNPFSTLRLALAYISDKGNIDWSNEIVIQYIIAGSYCSFLLVGLWLVHHQRFNWLAQKLPY